MRCAPHAEAAHQPSPPQPSAGARALARGWRALVGAYRALEATRWGGFLLGNAWPAYLFALLLAARAWGVAGRLPRGQSPRDQLALLQEILTILFLALVVLLFVARQPVRGRRADWRGGLVALTGTFLLNAVGLLPVAPDTSTAAFLLSSLVIVAGTLVTLWSLMALGRCFGILPEARGLVTRGPYRWVRHPIYLGELVSGLGIVVAKPHPAVFGLYGLFVLVQSWRTVLEEQALEEAFPGEYAAYRARTWRLVPGWR